MTMASAEQLVTPPQFAGLASATPGIESATLGWEAAATADPPATYQVFAATAAGAQDFYVRSTGNPTAAITAEVSGDLVTWQSGPGFTTIHQATDNGDGTETVVERMLAPIAESARHFMRLRVTPM